jgi:hypothetical protein
LPRAFARDAVPARARCGVSSERLRAMERAMCASATPGDRDLSPANVSNLGIYFQITYF